MAVRAVAAPSVRRCRSDDVCPVVGGKPEPARATSGFATERGAMEERRMIPPAGTGHAPLGSIVRIRKEMKRPPGSTG